MSLPTAKRNWRENPRRDGAREARTPDEVRAGIDPETGRAAAQADEPEFAPITASEMRGDPREFAVGPLKLTVQPLTRRQVRTHFLPLVEQWPQVIQFAAAVQHPACPGIDYEATAKLEHMYRLASLAEQKKAGLVVETPETRTASDVADEVSILVDTMNEQDEGIIADTVLLFTAATMPHLAREELLEQIGDLHIPEFADLLRELKYTLGNFKGSFSDRFTRP